MTLMEQETNTSFILYFYQDKPDDALPEACNKV